MLFPRVDTIPIPAPVWLMKLLGLLTLALHLVSVQLLIGSLLAILWFTWRGASTQSSTEKTAAYVLARRTTIIMTYVINLGIPPLLFAQVLYGRALYTSSDLMASVWLSVIPSLMLCYWLLYRIVDRTSKGKPAALMTIIAMAIGMWVGRILSFNMTLMLRPTVWHAMYDRTASGWQLPPHDPTGTPRWAFVMIGSLLAVGIWMILHSNLSTIEDDVKGLLRRTGSVLALFGGIGNLIIGWVAYSTQPSFIHQDLLANPLYKISAIVWAAGVVLATLLAATAYARSANLAATLAGSVACFVGLAGAVIVRDGIRDITLSQAGFNVWDRHEVSNWGVVGIFLVLFVATLGIIGWLLMVMRQAKPIPEQVAS